MKKKEEKNKFVQVLYTMFIKDAGYKWFAIGFGVLLWVLMTGLGL